MQRDYFDSIPPHRQWPKRPRAVRVPGQAVIDVNTVVMSIGSCFAEYMLAALEKYAFNVLDPYWGYKYSTSSILRELERAATGQRTRPDQLFLGRDGYTDLNHHRLYGETPEEALDLIHQVERLAGEMLPRAEVLVMTLGQNEVWRNKLTGEYILHPYPGVLNLQGNLEINCISLAENQEQLERIHALLMGLNPGLQIIVSVSPIPLRATYSEHDALVANNISKHTLHVAATEFAARHDNVHYFPGYDIVTTEFNQPEHKERDNRHPNMETIKAVISRFAEAFFTPEARELVNLSNALEAAPPDQRAPLLERMRALGLPESLITLKRANAAVMAQAYQEALELVLGMEETKNSPPLLYNAALLLATLERQDEARTHLEQALELLAEQEPLVFAGVRRENNILLGGNQVFIYKNTHQCRTETLTALRTACNEALGALCNARSVPCPLKLHFMESPAKFNNRQLHVSR